MREKVTLTNLHSGAVVERLNLELERIHRDIADPNTSNGARTLTLTLKVIPFEDRSDLINYEASCKANMGASPALKSTASLSIEDGKLVAREMIQSALPTKPTVVGMKKEGTR